MHIGLVGLGKMGNNMRARLRNAGHEVTGYDNNPAVSDVADLAALAAALPSPRIVWVMVPAGKITDSVFFTPVFVDADVNGAGQFVFNEFDKVDMERTINNSSLWEARIGFDVRFGN